jgi:hypothetical protein
LNVNVHGRGVRLVRDGMWQRFAMSVAAPEHPLQSFGVTSMSSNLRPNSSGPPETGKSMLRKSGYRFSVNDMRKNKGLKRDAF